jgi:hypothetical protein
MAAPETTTSAHVAYQSNPFRLIKPSWQGFKRGWTAYFLWLISLIVLLMMVTALMIVVKGLLGLLLFGLGTLVIMLYFGPAVYRITLAMARHEHILFAQAFSKDWRLGGRLLLTQALATLLTVLGLVALVVPGLLCLAWFFSAPYVVMEEGVWGMAALRRSRQLAAGRVADVLGTVSLGWTLGILALVPVLGPLVDMVASFVLVPVTAIRYYQLKALKPQDSRPAIRTSAWNYLAIVLALVGIIISVVIQAYDNRTNAPSSPVEKSSGLY